MTKPCSKCPLRGGQNKPELDAYCIGNGQVNQLYLQDKCGALNCMDDPMKIIQETKAYAIGNGQAETTNMYDKAGTLTCMHDQIAIMQEIGEQK